MSIGQERRRRISWVFAGIAFLCFMGMFALDSIYASNPKTPDESISRIYSRVIAFNGTVYLTDSEYWPYRWLIRLAAFSVMGIVFVRVAGYVQEKNNQRSTSDKDR